MARRDLPSGSAARSLLVKPQAVHPAAGHGLFPGGNKSFEENLNLACRIATMVVLLAMPQIVAKGTIFVFSDLVDQKILSAVALQYVFYTVQTTAGATLRQIVNCFVGLLLATSTILALEFAFPGGVKSDADPAAWTAMIVGCIYMVVVPWLNLPLVTVVFGCSRFAILWMQFTRPNVPMQNNLRMELGGCFFGGCAAMCANLVPSPQLASRKSVVLVHQLAATIELSWKDFNDYYLGTEKFSLEISRLKANLGAVYKQLQQLESHLQDSWWELAFSPMGRRARVMMNRQHELVFRAYGRLLDLLHLCQHEDFGDSHDLIAKALKGPIEAVTETACVLLRICIEASCDGDINDGEATEIESLVQQLVLKEQALADAYHEVKLRCISRFDPELERQGGSADSKISEKIMDEDAYTFEVTGFCRLVQTDAQDLLDSRSGARPLKAPRNPAGSLLNAFDRKVIGSPEQEEFALKTAMAIILAWLVGYQSSGVLLTHYDFRVPYLVGLLTKKGGGSAIQRSLSRLQGMILGFVSASLARVVVFNELDLDDWGGLAVTAEVLMMAMLFGLVFTGMFLYLHGSTPDTKFVGQLICVAGAPQLVVRAAADTEYNYRSSQTLTNSIIITLIIMAVVNCSFGTRVSQRAPKKLFELWDKVGRILDEVANPNVSSTEAAEGGVREMIAGTRYLGEEAAQEPRYWRTAWRSKLFFGCLDHMERIRLAARTIQIVGSKARIAGGERSDAFASVLRLDSFQQLAKMVRAKHRQAGKLLTIFEHETEQKLEVDRGFELEAQRYTAQWEELMKRFIAEINQPGNLRKQAKLTRSFSRTDVLVTLDDDVACQMSRIALNLSSILDEITALETDIIIASR